MSLPRLLRPGHVATAAGLLLAVLVAASSAPVPNAAQAAPAPAGQGFQLNAGDMRFILRQIKIAERHAVTETGPGQPLVGPGEFQIANPLLPFGLRTVDGSENNLQPGQDTYGAANQTFPRLTIPSFRPAESSNVPGVGLVGPPGTTTYAQKGGNVVDSHPRVVSNLIVDQTHANPAAVAAAGKPHRTFLGEPVVPCDAPDDPVGCTPPFQTLFIPNVTTDVGLSPPYNSWFTLFGQFFDHGVTSTAKSGGTVFVPLKDDDPLVAGPDHQHGTADDLPPNRRFMTITRAQNQPGPDGVLGTADDEQNATNTDSPWVDQSQTYASHSSHQVFLREYTMDAANRTMATGRMLTGSDGGMATWATTKAQALSRLGIRLSDVDALNVPLLATDQYGRFLRGPARGLPQLVTATGLVEGNTDTPVEVPGNARRIGIAFLDDIAHTAVPRPGRTPDGDDELTAQTAPQPAGTYDDEMLDRHYIAGDGRVNENIGLTAVHQVFHSEHNRLVDHMKGLITGQDIDVNDWRLPDGSWNGERLFQAARFVTEMEYQHLVFEEFGRKVSPGLDPFGLDGQSQTDLNPAIQAEFAHAVYRFGHSMLTDTVARTNADGTPNDLPLLAAFLNPPAFTDGGSAGILTPEEATGSIAMGMTDQAGNELDEFVTETLRNNLLGLPLDLAAINMARARETGVPPLNGLRRQLYATTHDGALKPYTDWVDFGLALKHPDSLVNFMAAYGKHPTITGASTIAGKRLAAQRIHDNEPSLDPATPADSLAFLHGTGTWANTAAGVTTTGLDDVDLWVGGLAESQNLFGGLLGSTFNYVFEQQMTDLQNGDRFYYLSRTPGLNLRTQLEGNSFAELIMRNSDARSLKAEVFSTADCEFELGNLQGTDPGAITDDVDSECDEGSLLIRMADGTIRYRTQNAVDPPGLNAQSTFNGTSGADRVQGGVDNDTFWGNEDDDTIEGNDGSDVALGGDGNDVITDSAGEDNLKGGDGNDAIDAGPGLDLVQSGFGDDFIDGGMNENVIFAGEGNDYLITGNGADHVEGDGGDDWLEGGNANDLLQADTGAPFFDDNNEPGHDVLIGGGGADDYDAEGGDDIMLAGPGIEKNAGLRGFDWVTHARDPQAADDDLNLRVALLTAPVDITRDRFTDVEGVSGWKFNDTLRGDDGGHPAGNDLTAAGTARIAGLQTILGAGSTFSSENNIILGGGGSDTLEGRGGNDIIEGDKWLNVQLRTPDAATASATDTKLVDSITEVRDDVFARRVDPGDFEIVRTIENAPSGGDRAVFSGPRADYDITPNVNPVEMTVAHTRGTQDDGIDTLRGIEELVFTDSEVDLAPEATLAPDRSFAARNVNTTSPAQVVTLSNVGFSALAISNVAIVGPLHPGDFAISNNGCGTNLPAGSTCSISVTFRPTAGGTRTALLRVTDNHDNVPGSRQQVNLTGVGIAPNSPATGTPTISDTTPQLGQTLTVNAAAVADADGLGTLNFQWQQTNPQGVGAFANIPGATNTSFTVPGNPGAVGRRYRVNVSFTDQAGNPESVLSLSTEQTGIAIAPATALQSTADTTANRSVVTGSVFESAAAGGDRLFALEVSTPRLLRLTPGRYVVKVKVTRQKGGTLGRRVMGTVHLGGVTGKRLFSTRMTERRLHRLRPGAYLVRLTVAPRPR